MTRVDDAADTLTEALWQDITEEAPPTPAAPSVSTGGRAGFFGSLAASLGLRRKRWISYGRQPILTPSDIVAQNYPHLYIHLMCG